MAISDFLLENVQQDETKEVHLKRFKSPFVIRSIDESLNDTLKKRATIKKKNRQGVAIPEFNNEKYIDSLMSACVVTPDLKDAQLQESYRTVGDEAATLKAMLKIGEYNRLMQEIQSLNGFDEDINDLVEEAKND